MSPRTTLVTTIALTLSCTELTESKEKTPIDVPARASLSVSPSNRLPEFTAPLTEALLQSADSYPDGTYNNREFGCCSPKHLGHDYAGDAGTPVIALASGVVVPSPVSGPHCNYGNVVVVWSKLTDGTEFTVVYGHLSEREGMKPTLSGTVRRGDIIGYISHSGGSSPSGPRCGTDDENGDGDEHVHIAVRLGHPPTNANGEPTWVYYGYGGHGDNDDAFTSVESFTNCHGTHAGLLADQSWNSASNIMRASYCAEGGYARFGDSQNVGYGNAMVDMNGVWCQNFKRQHQSFQESEALCFGNQGTQSYALPWAIWFPFSIIGAGGALGAPTANAQPNQLGMSQRFERGTVSTESGGVARVVLDNGTTYVIDGDYITRTDGGSSGSSMSSSSSSSSAMTSSSSSSASSSSSSSSSSSGSLPENNEDPPYTDCGRHGFNLVVNGDFNLPPLECGWMLENALGGGHAEQAYDANGEARARVWTTTPADPWRTQLKTYVHVYGNQRYLFRFKVRAEGSADRFIVQLMKEDSPWTNYGLWIDAEIPAGIEQTFEIPFTSTTTDPYARLTFQFGQTSTVFTIDQIWLERLPE